MSESLLKTLSETMSRLVGPEGKFTSNAHAAKSTGVSRSTIDRIRNATKPGISAVGIDKIATLSEGLGIEGWQLMVPGMSLDRPPRLESAAKDPHEIELLDVFRQLGSAEKIYVILKAREMLAQQYGDSPSKSTRSDGAA